MCIYKIVCFLADLVRGLSEFQGILSYEFKDKTDGFCVYPR